MKKLSEKAKGHIWIASIAILTLIAHVVTSTVLGFHRDEFLYLQLGHHLSAGYWSNPPFIGFMSFFIQLFGKSLFVLRLFPAILGMVVIYLTGLITFELGGKLYAQVLACFSFSISILFLRAFSMFQPVCFDIFFWTLILYLFLRYVNTEKPLFLLLLGVAVGFGMLNKYMILFLGAGLALGALATPYRKLWINKYTFLALLAALIIFLPNIIWQYLHGFPVMHHMKELHDTQLVNVSRVNIVIEQILMFAFCSFIWVAGLVWLLMTPKYRVFAFSYIAIVILFVLMRGKSYYTAGLYPFMFAAGGVSWEFTFKKISWRVALPVFLFIMALPLLPGSLTVGNPKWMAGYFSNVIIKMGGESMLRWEDARLHPLPQDYADMLGWDELGKIVVKACDTIKDKNRIMIYCENYGQAGSVDYCGRCHGLPPAVSFSDSYRLWVPDSVRKEQDIFFYVNDELGRDVDSIFAQIDTVGRIENPYAREYGTTVFMCRKPVADFPKFWKERVAWVKSH
jgi:hypothetical protein